MHFNNVVIHFETRHLQEMHHLLRKKPSIVLINFTNLTQLQRPPEPETILLQ